MSDTQEENSTLNKMSQSKDNESDNINLHDNSSESLRRSERNRKLTENGMEWKISRHLANFRNAVSMWRKCANRVQVVRSDSTSLDEIRKARDKLDGSIGEISEIYQETLQVLAQGVDRGDLDNNESLENELLKKYESIECEHQHIMRDIANHIREMEAVRSETRSTRSRGSLSSSRSTSSSNKSAATIKAAELKARLKYIDIEARSKAELEKIQTMKELDVTRAKLEVMDTFDNLENSFAELDIKPSIESLPSFGAGEYTENYVRTQEAQPSKTDEKPQQEWSNTENSIYLNEPLSKPSENSGNIT
ncbi:desmoplakin-like isoform X1 [Argopecten irradians]|uniref:desmoplakin-like isoform X1 n=1 Tax=Argopecten irradians TaxID=31199 RepID=UPI003717BCB5